MKKILIIAIIVIFVFVIIYSLFFGVEVINSSQRTDTKPEDISLVQELFKKNNIDLNSRLFLMKVSKDQIGINLYFGEQLNGIGTMSRVIMYHFNKNGDLVSTFPKEPDLIPDDFSTNPKISATKAVAIAITKSKYKALYKQAELLIIDQKTTLKTGVAPNGVAEYKTELTWILSWKITPLNKEIPVVYLDANTGKIIYEDDGVRY